VNNYGKDAFNGDIGQIAKIDLVEREVTVRFDQREVVYDFGERDEVPLAYATTIHTRMVAVALAHPPIVQPSALLRVAMASEKMPRTSARASAPTR
jgi:exodeoxyribonuclease V alpha subunit